MGLFKKSAAAGRGMAENIQCVEHFNQQHCFSPFSSSFFDTRNQSVSCCCSFLPNKATKVPLHKQFSARNWLRVSNDPTDTYSHQSFANFYAPRKIATLIGKSSDGLQLFANEKNFLNIFYKRRFTKHSSNSLVFQQNVTNELRNFFVCTFVCV